MRLRTNVQTFKFKVYCVAPFTVDIADVKLIARLMKISKLPAGMNMLA